MSNISTYFHTLKYLKFTQVLHRALKKFKHIKINEVKVLCAAPSGEWTVQELYSQKFINDTEVCFLNQNGCVNKKLDWNNCEQDKLWLYNLHYFDELQSFGSNARQDLQLSWVHKWINDNPAVDGGNGWESYTLSLRIVNWTKAFLSGLETNQKFVSSLALQADFLSQDLEKHLLGNHYFVNLKALVFAGCYCEGKAADSWLRIGLKDYEKELNEQVLNDGGNFELTPMYHSIMLTDLLDLYNLFKVFPSKVPASAVEVTKKIIVKMLAWLNMMSLGDDKVSFFNDSAFGIASENSILREYATKLGFKVVDIGPTENLLLVHNLQNTGYVSVKSPELTLIADLAPVGPSYIPGHAHADSLSFELSLGKSRVFVNSGTSVYGMSDERLRQRGTSAHNTVVINNKNSSEVWSGFRVARRAAIGNRVIGKVKPNQTVEFSAAHNGYKKQGINCIHHRTWQVSLTGCEVKDFLQGDFNSAIAYLHLHPEVFISSTGSDACVLQVELYEIEVKVTGASLTIEDSSWHPEFGLVIPSKKLRLQYLQQRVTYQIIWKKL